MVIQAILTVWLLVLIFLTNRFRRERRIPQQRIFSIFLIVWAILGILYYDVWSVTSGWLDAHADSWQTYLPVVFFSICAGLGTYYLLQTFGKFRAMAEKNQKDADARQAAKQKKKKAEQRKAEKEKRSVKDGQAPKEQQAPKEKQATKERQTQKERQAAKEKQTANKKQTAKGAQAPEKKRAADAAAKRQAQSDAKAPDGGQPPR